MGWMKQCRGLCAVRERAAAAYADRHPMLQIPAAHQKSRKNPLLPIQARQGLNQQPVEKGDWLRSTIDIPRIRGP
jgi:hypothetical protein